MSVEYKFETPNDYFLLSVDRLVNDCLSSSNVRKKNIDILKINKDSLTKIAPKGRAAFASNLIDKIDYLLKLEEGE